jgi:hypothetical protein
MEAQGGDVTREVIEALADGKMRRRFRDFRPCVPLLGAWTWTFSSLILSFRLGFWPFSNFSPTTRYIVLYT